MSVATSAPWAGRLNRQIIRAPVNPFDKSTIVSILPKRIEERKCTLQPGLFELKPGTFENPSILVVGPSSWWREVGEYEPLLEIGVSSVVVADSVVKDYCNGLLACNMADQMPGIFYVPGDLDIIKLRKEHMPLLIKARENQKRWFLELVRIADILWSRSNGNPLAISEDARLATRELNLLEKPWLKNYQMAELIKCVSCGSLRDGNFPVCPNCKVVVDKEKAKELGLTFASQ